MDIALIYFDGCPSWCVARERVEHALAQLQAADTRITLVRVESEGDGADFHGSPTILVDGQDLFPDQGAADSAAVPPRCSGLACRLYSSVLGLSGSPSVEEIVAALRGRIEVTAAAPTSPA